MPVVLAYHGCDRTTAEAVLDGAPFRESVQPYDWLGRGIYFWEEDPLRALQWARARRPGSPSVIGAAIETGHCLDLTRQSGSLAVSRTYKLYQREQERLGRVMPRNLDPASGVPGDLALRYLDRAVVDYLNVVRDKLGERPFETIRALFPEGEALYPNAGFRKLTHVQICIREQANVLGVFRVREEQRRRLGMPVLYD